MSSSDAVPPPKPRRKPLQNPHPSVTPPEARPGPPGGRAVRMPMLPDGMVGDAGAGSVGQLGRPLVEFKGYGEAGYRPLQGMQYGPGLMAANTRASLFPDKQQSVLDSVRLLYVSAAWKRIAAVERQHTAKCRKPRVVGVEPVPRVMQRAWEVAESVWSGGARLVGSEWWTVDRCGAERQRYRVNYFQSPDDAYWVHVLPTNLSGLRDVVATDILGIK